MYVIAKGDRFLSIDHDAEIVWVDELHRGFKFSLKEAAAMLLAVRSSTDESVTTVQVN